MSKGRKVPPPDADPIMFLKERDAALLSMDEATIRAYFLRWHGDAGPADPDTFWIGVHKARTASITLPMDARSESKRWLLARGSRSLDDGEVPV
jgi:hypothetical protein